MKKLVFAVSWTIFVFVLIASGPIAYNISSFASRLVLIATFLSLVLLMIFSGRCQNQSIKKKVTLVALSLTALLFILWRASLVEPDSIKEILSWRTFGLAQEYKEGHLTFYTAHSYFFAEPLVLNFLYVIGGFSPVIGLYVSLLVHGILVVLISILILEILLRAQIKEKNSNVKAIFPYLLAFSIVSFLYSERSTYGTNLPLLEVPLILWLLLSPQNGTYTQSKVTILLLVIGTTLGDPMGALLLILFFFMFSIFEKKTAILYSIIPMSYMLYAAYSYTLSLKVYMTFALEGMYEFLKNLLAGQFATRVIPWQRSIAPIKEDTIVVSAAYLSLIFLSFMMAVILTLIWLKSLTKRKKDGQIWSLTGSLWLILGVAVLSYIGASVKAETPFSDIRTILLALIMLLLPFLFTYKELASLMNASKILSALIIVLLIISSLGTIYGAYPKSIHDPIAVVEDSRLNKSIYPVERYIQEYFRGGYFIVDYQMLKAAFSLSSSQQYEISLLTEEALAPGLRSYYVLVFNINGIKYSSIYISPKAYLEAYNVSLTKTRVYDNGDIVIVLVVMP